MSVIHEIKRCVIYYLIIRYTARPFFLIHTNRFSATTGPVVYIIMAIYIYALNPRTLSSVASVIL